MLAEFNVNGRFVKAGQNVSSAGGGMARIKVEMGWKKKKH
jgi:hypothetical protein